MVRKNIVFFLSVILVVVFDQITKWLVSSSRVMFDWGFLKFHLILNTGAGFGILKGHVGILALVSVGVCGLILWYYPKIEKDVWSQVLWGIVLGGTIGNLIDRVARGVVIDFIDFGWWPAFNIADSALVVGVLALVVMSFKEDFLDRKKKKKSS